MHVSQQGGQLFEMCVYKPDQRDSEMLQLVDTILPFSHRFCQSPTTLNLISVRIMCNENIWTIKWVRSAELYPAVLSRKQYVWISPTNQKTNRQKKILLELDPSNPAAAHTSSDPRAQTDAEPPQSTNPTNTSVSKPDCFR